MIEGRNGLGLSLEPVPTFFAGKLQTSRHDLVTYIPYRNIDRYPSG
jgi:hypothetical protein